VRSLLWAAGFNFGHAADLITTAPYDPLPFLFFGEEIAMAVRTTSSDFVSKYLYSD
jgi:hypothetical protein